MGKADRSYADGHGAIGAFAHLAERAAVMRARTARLVESRITSERIY